MSDRLTMLGKNLPGGLSSVIGKVMAAKERLEVRTGIANTCKSCFATSSWNVDGLKLWSTAYTATLFWQQLEDMPLLVAHEFEESSIPQDATCSENDHLTAATSPPQM
jgi:hypothetical protein